MELVGTSSPGTVDADNFGAGQELRRQPDVPPGREIRPAALPDPEGRTRQPTCFHDMAEVLK